MRLLITMMIFLAGCTITIKPLPQPARKKTYHATRHKAANVKPKTYVVDSGWIANYKAEEHEHGNYTIPDDHQITLMSDGRFRVPKSVMEHFQDLSRAEPPSVSPVPTPSSVFP